ncbi:hypothetical protein [Dyella ginsengisoli]|uniref:hypothetical protein n=1 Tax=Dyella ginsengisoli TaxID=363848 RepID=UPI000362A64A|nr:hypothetical protein [Dyella ginsengisoli]
MEHEQELRRCRSISLQRRLNSFQQGPKIGMSGEVATEFIQQNSTNYRAAKRANSILGSEIDSFNECNQIRAQSAPLLGIDRLDTAIGRLPISSTGDLV